MNSRKSHRPGSSLGQAPTLAVLLCVSAGLVMWFLTGMPLLSLLLGICLLLAGVGLVFFLQVFVVVGLVLPHELGHWLMGRINGLTLYYASIWPLVYSPRTRKLRILRNRQFLGFVAMWRADGGFDALATRWFIVGGALGNFFVGLVALVGSRLSNSSWSPLIALFGACSLAFGAYNLSPWLAASGQVSDGRLLNLLKKDPVDFGARLAVGQMLWLAATRVPQADWPQGIRERAVEGARTFETKSYCLQGLVEEATYSQNPELIAHALQNGSQAVDGWPVEAREAAMKYRTYASTLMAITFPGTPIGRELLPEAEGLSRTAAIRRLCAVAAVLASESGVESGRATLEQVSHLVKVSHIPFDERAGIENLRSRVQSFLGALDGKYSAMYQVQTLWMRGVRPREWPRELIGKLENYKLAGGHWGFCVAARLAYWRDVRDLARLEQLVQEIASNSKLEDVPPALRSRIWSDLAVYYVIVAVDLRKAEDALVRAEQFGPGVERSLLAAKAAVLALSGRAAESLAALDELRSFVDRLPAWISRPQEEREVWAEIESLSANSR